MSAKLQKIEKNVAVFEVEVEEKDFLEAIAKAYRKNVGKINMPGFRKGKAPQKMIEKYYGESFFYEDAINIALPDAYEKAVEELQLEPIDRPTVDVKSVGAGENLVAQITVPVKPEVELGEYMGIEIEKREHNVSDADVATEINKLLERNARIVSVENRAVQNGDIATIDFKGIKDGEPFEGGMAENYDLEIGAGQFIPGFEPQLIGKNIGDEFNIKVTFPKEYHSESLAGQDVEFEIKIHGIKAKELPELDDEFAKDVSEFDTLAEFKSDIRAKLEEEAEQAHKVEMENAVIDKIVENMKVDLPEILIENELNQIMREMNIKLSGMGMNFESFLQMSGVTLDDFKKENRERAITQAKSNLAIEKIATLEKVEVTDAEIEEKLKELSEKYNVSVEEIKRTLEVELLQRDIRFNKAVKLVVESAKQV